MTTATNPNVAIYKTLISANAGPGCSEVKTNGGVNFLNGDELAKLEVRVRIYEKRKSMYQETDRAVTNLNRLFKLIEDAPARSKFASSSQTSYTDQKDEIEGKLKSFGDEFLREYKVLEDEDLNAKPVGGLGFDVRDAQGLAPAVSGGPFKNSDADLNIALIKYKPDQGAYKLLEDAMGLIAKFNLELKTLERISPQDEESLLTKFNFNPWDLVRAGDPGLNEIAIARTERERLISKYIDAFNGYQPTNDAAAEQKKIDTYVNPQKQADQAQGSNNQFPLGQSGMDIIHGIDDADLRLAITDLNNQQSALSAQIGGTTAAKNQYRTEFGINSILDPKVEVQIAGLQSAADVNAAAVKRRKIIAKLSSYNMQGVDIQGMDDKALKILLDENEAAFKAYYSAYQESPDVSFQQTATLTQVIQDTQLRNVLNRRADKIMNNALKSALILKVLTDNGKYQTAIEKREKMVSEFLDIGGVNQNPSYKDLDDNRLQQEFNVRKALIDRVRDLYEGQQIEITEIMKNKNTDVQLEIQKREGILQSYSDRGLNDANDSATYSDQVIQDRIKAHDDEYNAAISDITVASGVAKVGDAATNMPTLADLRVELKTLSDARALLIGKAQAILSANTPNTDVNGEKLGDIVASLGTSQLSNAKLEDKIKEIETVLRAINASNSLDVQLKSYENGIGVTQGLINGIDMSDLTTARQTATQLGQALTQTGNDLDSFKQTVDTDSSLDGGNPTGPQRKRLDQEVARVKALLEDERVRLAKKDQDISDAIANAANTQQSAARIEKYRASITQQNLQSSGLTDDFNVTYETTTDNAISLFERLMQEEMDRINKRSGVRVAEASAFGEKLKELAAGDGNNFGPGEEISITIQLLSNFDSPDDGAITGNSGDSQRTAFAQEIKFGGKLVKIIQSDNPEAPFKALDLGWDEADDVDKVFISSYARIVPNRDSAGSITMLKEMGLEWLTETIYVDMLDRTNVYNYNGFLRHYKDLLADGQNKDVSKRAEYTANGKPLTCAIELPGNKTLGGIFGVPLDKVTVGVAQGSEIEYLAAPSIGGLINEIRNTLIHADRKPGDAPRFFPNKDERRDINNILKTFFIQDGDGVKAYPTADTINVEDDAGFSEPAWKAVLDAEAMLPEEDRVYLAKGTKAASSYKQKSYEQACADAAFAFIQNDLLDLTKIKLRVHSIQPYGNMQTVGAQNKAGKPYLCLQCSGLNDYCVVIKDNRSPEFDFFDESRKLYIFNMDGKDLDKYNLAKSTAVTTAANNAGQSFLDTDDEDVSTFRFIPNI